MKSAVRNEIVLETINSARAHAKKHGNRKMSLSELRKLCGLTK